MYSLHGLLALMRAVFFEVCQRLMVVSNCIPGSPQCQVASLIFFRSSFALWVFTTEPSRIALVEKSVSRTTEYMKSSVTRTELLAFWKKMELYASESGEEPSYPACTSDQALASSLALHSMKSTISGWSMLRMTIFAARRVLPPDLITPANESKPFMKLSGPLAVPPPLRPSVEERSGDRFVPVPLPHLKSMPSVLARVRIESSESFTELMKQAEHCGVRYPVTLNSTRPVSWFQCQFCASELGSMRSQPTLNQTGELNAAY